MRHLYLSIYLSNIYIYIYIYIYSKQHICSGYVNLKLPQRKNQSSPPKRQSASSELDGTLRPVKSLHLRQVVKVLTDGLGPLGFRAFRV